MKFTRLLIYCFCVFLELKRKKPKKTKIFIKRKLNR